MKFVIPRSRDILFTTIFIGIILIGPRLFNLDSDLGRHITIGNYILDHWDIPVSDIFSHTMNGAPLTPHEWLAQVVFASVHRLAGLDGVIIVTALVLATAFTLVYLELIKRGVNPLIALPLTILAAAASSIHFLARPHIFTILFLAIWTPILIRLDTAKKSTGIIYLPLIMLIWVNTHGAYIAGLVTGGAILVGAIWDWMQSRLAPEALRRIGLSAGLSILVIFINPVGADSVKTSFGYIQNKYLVEHTQEYFPPNFHNPSFWPFLLLIALTIFAFSLGKSRLRTGESLLVAGWMAMGLYSARNIPLFAIVATPILGTVIESGIDGWRDFTALGNRLVKIESSLIGIVWPFLSVFAAVVLSINGIFGTRNTYNPRIFPSQAVDWLEAHPQNGNMFNYFNWGGYILYRGWPHYLVFIDGQTDFYGEALTREYEQVITQRKGWGDILNKYDIEWALLPVAEPLAMELKDSGWHVLYEDAVAVILKEP